MSDVIAWSNEVARLKAEIERLELEVAAWKQASDLKAKEIGRLQAQNDLCRGALQQLFDCCDDVRRALEGK